MELHKGMLSLHTAMFRDSITSQAAELIYQSSSIPSQAAELIYQSSSGSSCSGNA